MIGLLMALAASAYTFDVPKLYPRAYAEWRADLPVKFVDQDWALLRGTAGPLRSVTVHGRQMLFGTSCMPHDCGNNNAGILFTPDGKTVMGGLFVVEGDPEHAKIRPFYVGSPTTEEQACIEDFSEDYEENVC